MIQDIRLANSVEQALKMLNDKIERLARKSPAVTGARLTTSAPQSLTVSTWTALTLGTVEDKQGGITVSGSTVTIQSDGVYAASLHARHGSASTTYVESALASGLSGGLPVAYAWGPAGGSQAFVVTVTRFFTAGSVIIPYVYTSASGVSVQGTSAYAGEKPVFNIYKVG